MLSLLIVWNARRDEVAPLSDMNPVMDGQKL